MNYLLHRQQNPNSTISIPDGLTDLMGDICREVLRVQPSPNEIYSFIATYLEALLETRDKIQITRKTLCDIISRATNIANILQVDGFTLKQANETVNIMHKNFFEILDSKRKEKFDERHSKEIREAEILSELVKTCELTKYQVLFLKPVIREAFKNFIEEYFRALKGMALSLDVVSPISKFTLEKYFADAPSLEIMTEAAVSIQAAFRGYRTRKILRKSTIKYMPGTIRLNDLPYQKFEKLLQNFTPAEYKKAYEAAIVIQRAYRKSMGTNHLKRSLREYEYKNEEVAEKSEHEKGFEKFGKVNKIEENAATIIQKAFRNYKKKQESLQREGNI